MRQYFFSIKGVNMFKISKVSIRFSYQKNRPISGVRCINTSQVSRVSILFKYILHKYQYFSSIKSIHTFHVYNDILVSILFKYQRYEYFCKIILFKFQYFSSVSIFSVSTFFKYQYLLSISTFQVSIHESNNTS